MDGDGGDRIRRTCVFLGPTLALAEARARLPGATFLPPAAQGDVHAACAGKPWALVIVDGVFDQRLAVWHKEILWALAQGIRVYGAASMGALRAAELAAFGMIGVGEVFQGFAGGALEDDDEVAVAVAADGGGGEAGRHRATSEAMVNVRATLARAVAEGAIAAVDGEALVGVGKRLFYPERSLAAILASARAAAERSAPVVTEGALAALEAWLGPDPRARVVDQKRLDAEAVLDRVRADARASDGGPRPPSFRFAYTEAWHELRSTLETAGATTPVAIATTEPAAVATAATGAVGAAVAGAADVEDDRRLLQAVRGVLGRAAPAELAELWREAEARALAVALARAAGVTVDAARLQAASEAFRRARALMSPAATHAWMREAGLDVERWSAMIHDQLLAEEGRRLVSEDDTLAQLAALLRARGRFAELASEARRLLAEAPLSEP